MPHSCRAPAWLRENVLQCEDTRPTDEPPRGDERTFGEHSPVACFVHQPHLFERRVEDQLVRAGHVACAHARYRNCTAESLTRRARERAGGAGGSILLRRMMRLQKMRIEGRELSEESRRFCHD